MEKITSDNSWSPIPHFPVYRDPLIKVPIYRNPLIEVALYYNSTYLLLVKSSLIGHFLPFHRESLLTS